MSGGPGSSVYLAKDRLDPLNSTAVKIFFSRESDVNRAFISNTRMLTQTVSLSHTYWARPSPLVN